MTHRKNQAILSSDQAEAATTKQLHTDARFQLVLSWGGWPTDVPLHPLASVHDNVWLLLQVQLRRGLRV